MWGDTVRARRVEGERITMALVELAADSIVPEHRHENEQLGMVVTGDLTFTIGDETRALGPGGTWRIPSMIPHQVSVGPAGAVCHRCLRADPCGLGRPAEPSAVGARLARPSLIPAALGTPLVSAGRPRAAAA